MTRKSPVLSIDLLGWSGSVGHHGEEIETALMSPELVANLGILAIKIVEMLAASRHRLEVIKMIPRMGGHCNREITSVNIRAIFSEFYFVPKVEVKIDATAHDLKFEGLLPALVDEMKTALVAKVSELSNRFSSATSDVERFIGSLT